MSGWFPWLHFDLLILGAGFSSAGGVWAFAVRNWESSGRVVGEIEEVGATFYLTVDECMHGRSLWRMGWAVARMWETWMEVVDWGYALS